MKIKSALSLGLISFGLSVGGFTYINNPRVEASVWHKGTPKVLRYSFITKGGGAKMNWTSFDGYKRGFVVGHMGMPGIMVNHSKYRHVGHTYILKGYAKKNGTYKGGNVTFKMKKSSAHYVLSGDLYLLTGYANGKHYCVKLYYAQFKIQVQH